MINVAVLSWEDSYRRFAALIIDRLLLVFIVAVKGLWQCEWELMRTDPAGTAGVKRAATVGSIETHKTMAQSLDLLCSLTHKHDCKNNKNT